MWLCKGCKAKNEEIQYLRKLIDNLLLRLQVAPINPKIEENFEEIEEEKDTEVVGD